MRYIKVLISIVLLIFTGSVIGYADKKVENFYVYKYMNLVDDIDCDFEFYNIKGYGNINYYISEQKMYEIAMDIATKFGLKKEHILLEKEWNNKTKNIIIKSINYENTIKIEIIQKNDTESYIIVDISNNKVYKHIVDNYETIDESIRKYSYNVDINMCICVKCSKKLYFSKNNEIFANILYNMNAREISIVEDKNFISMTAYSKNISNTIDVMGEKINLNIGMRYSETEDDTYIYIATPIIKLDY